jgi:type IV pilus assembly protein PilX
MRAVKINGGFGSPRKQQGVVLLIALIILVAMTLAGIGMMRSVDTGTVIAGNLAFRQASLNAADAGTSNAFAVLTSYTNSGNSADKSILDLNNGQPCPGGVTPALCTGVVNIPGYAPTPFYACEVNHTCTLAAQNAWWTVDNNWTNARSLPAVTDANGKTIATVSYLIQRMCTLPGPANAGGAELCQTITQAGTGCSKSQLEPCLSTSVYYRITSRSIGTRNSVTYTQTFVVVSL